MKILNKIQSAFQPPQNTQKGPAPEVREQNSPLTQEPVDRVQLSELPKKAIKKLSKLKLGTLVHGTIGAVCSTLPLIGATAIAGGAAALPWAMDTEKNVPHSSPKSIAAGAAGLIGGTLLNVGGLAAAAATGTLLPLLPAAIAGGYLFGKMAQIDSSMGRFDAF